MARKRITVLVSIDYEADLGTSKEVADAFGHMLATTPCAALSEDLGVTLVSARIAGPSDWREEWVPDARRRAIDRNTPMWVVDLLDRAAGSV